MVMSRKTWMILMLLLGNSLLLFSQNCHIGDIIVNPDGSKGVVFWVNDNRTAGWMVAMQDANNNQTCRWGLQTYNALVQIPFTTTQDAFRFDLLMNELDGKENTRKIREKAQTMSSEWPSSYAAGVVDYDNGWYLPSIGQLRILFANLGLIETKLASNNEFTTLLSASGKKYWSSTQNGQNSAWAVNGQACYITSNQKDTYNYVRAIRDFDMTGGFATYQWSPIDNATADMYVWQEDNYTVTVTMGISCSASDSQYITVESMDDVVLDSVTACESYEWEGETYTVSGNYTKVFTTPAGCEYQVTLPLTIIYTPSVTLIADDDVICEGESTTIHATAEHGVPQLVSVGDILCTDGSIIPLSDWSSNNGKTAKGIVCYVDFTGGHGWAVGLNDLGTASWCSTDVLVQGLTNYTTPREAMYDLDGAYNTQTIRATGNASQFPAVFKLNNNMINEGWYLPSIGQWRILFVNLDIINASLDSLGGTALTLVKNKGYWSSTQCDASKKWMLTERASVKTETGTNITNRYVRTMCSF